MSSEWPADLPVFCGSLVLLLKGTFGPGYPIPVETQQNYNLLNKKNTKSRIFKMSKNFEQCSNSILARFEFCKQLLKKKKKKDK